MFFGEKLTNLRELNGFSRKDLAQLLSVTEQSVWQYEKTAIIPKIHVLNGLKTLFHVDSKYFFTQSAIQNHVNENSVAYRASDRDSRKKTKFELTYLNYLDFYLQQFEQYLITPNPKILDLYKKSQMTWLNSTLTQNQRLSQIAKEARSVLQLKHNQDLMYCLELSGIYIVEKDLGVTIDAYSTWTEDRRPFIILGNIKKSAVRRNFDLAHELGHLLLHSHVNMAELSKKDYRLIEKQANQFASDFLLPEAEFKSDFSDLTHRSNPDSYIDLKQKYQVSIAALEYRAYSLKLINYQENRYFYGVMNKKGYRTLEPLDDQLPPVKPGKIKSLFEMILNHHLLDLNDFLAEFGIKPEFLINLFNLPPKFFDRFMMPQRHYFNNAKILPFHTRKLKEN